MGNSLVAFVSGGFDARMDILLTGLDRLTDASLDAQQLALAISGFQSTDLLMLPTPQLGQTGGNHGEVVRLAGPGSLKELARRTLSRRCLRTLL